MKQAVVGLLAHVDAGKTTLAEAMLLAAGAIRTAGRVDRGDSHLDTDPMERERGITIFASQASLDWDGTHIMLLDAPGHVDFSAEAERTIAALDCALLVVGANDGIQGHTETLWDLLRRHQVPTLIFVNKCDLEHPGRSALMADLRVRLSPACLDGAAFASGDPRALEDAASADEAALDEYLETGSIAPASYARLVAERSVFPVFFGAALRNDGVRELLDALAALAPEHSWPTAFAARVFRISRSDRGERLSWLKVTGGTLRAKMMVEGTDHDAPWAEKINEIRLYQGKRHETVAELPAGSICAVTGLTHTMPGSALGAEAAAPRPLLAPVLSYQVIPAPETDASALVRALRELASEDPLLGVTWHEQLQEAHVQLMGEVQQDVVRELLRDRYGIEVGFGPGGILYKETVTAPAEGVGHFEPLRHYAEVRLLVEPLPRGSGVEFGTRCPVDDLDLNWQRLILTNAMERDHLGVLAGAPLTDVRITLLAGRAHAKHTEGGDFRQATYRAVRQGLKKAESVLLEPVYAFRLEIPSESTGRALNDIQRMYGSFEPPEMEGDMTVITGTAPVVTMRDYQKEVVSYTHGTGKLFCSLKGYAPCKNQDEVVQNIGYDPEFVRRGIRDPYDLPLSGICHEILSWMKHYRFEWIQLLHS